MPKAAAKTGKGRRTKTAVEVLPNDLGLFPEPVAEITGLVAAVSIGDVDGDMNAACALSPPRKKAPNQARRRQTKQKKADTICYADDPDKYSVDPLLPQVSSTTNISTAVPEKATGTAKSFEGGLAETDSIHSQAETSLISTIDNTELRVIGWADVCLENDKIEKIAEASYAEVYRVTNEEGVSIIKVIRLESPIKAQTTQQKRSGLVDEEPHAQGDLMGELRISEWLADIPGFVVYKERYVVKGKAPKALLDTHQAFQRKCKRQDPGRLQFYPSPSRYLDDTKFLVVELGDAGTALEDFKLTTQEQLWDVFFLVAIALARAEELVLFESVCANLQQHRDLHEGNLCLRQVCKPRTRDDSTQSQTQFGYSGLDITILDYGLSRAEDPECGEEEEVAVAYDLEKDLSLFTSTHADQCKVYRQMRSFLLKGEREWLAPERHNIPYESGVEGPICWEDYAPYTNVLWLAYIYEYMERHFRGPKKELASFTRSTKELWQYLDPEAPKGAPCFGSAEDVVRFAVEAGWILSEQLMGTDGSTLVENEREGLEDKDVLETAEKLSQLGLEGQSAENPVVKKSQRQRRTNGEV
ncbi:hypothetical protein CFIMG_007993RA00001 [Ceratocystis fimbriata CBS 114723]|uniref:non-specific serine/threonine protein kinase n=1 Tax=Ceratocystis fimbriata CBS 114723 TaxID=1035309 RepID=A0A2C5XLB3_9PEZI|nr:hypothetical protein CFIMG_007993RA00001 [Ceratocystis fimbriata CBS 114723]